jgi:HK97 family phage prohead protease
MIDGIQTANYANNPVILWRHESHNLPIAICSNLNKINNKLIGDIEFSQKLADKYPDVQMFIDYIEEKYLRTVSIGFKPINKRVEKQGDNLVIIHEVCDLVECSVVTIPMNPNATIMREYNMQTKEGRVLATKHRDKLIQCQLLINELLEDSAMNEDKPNEDKKPIFDENLLENSFRNINKKELENLLLNKTII